jgi:pilus assembly protein Flp/PilA
MQRFSFKHIFIHGNPEFGEEGQGLVEYALILFLVAIVVIAILILLGPQIGSVFSGVTKGLGGNGHCLHPNPQGFCPPGQN